MFTHSLSLTYYLCILRFIYPIPFPIDSVINQFRKGAQGLHTRTVQLRGMATRGRAQHAHLRRRVLARRQWREKIWIFQAVRVLTHPRSSTPRCTDGETEARKTGVAEQERTKGEVEASARCLVATGWAQAELRSSEPEQPGTSPEPDGPEPEGTRGTRGGCCSGRALPTKTGEASKDRPCPPLRRWTRRCGRRTPSWRQWGLCAARIPGPSFTSPCEPQCAAAALSLQ